MEKDGLATQIVTGDGDASGVGTPGPTMARHTPLGLLPFLAEEHKATPPFTTRSSVEPEDAYSYGNHERNRPHAHKREHIFATPDYVEKREEDFDDALIP